MPTRAPCSALVYHCEVRSAKLRMVSKVSAVEHVDAHPGVTADSQTPSMNLTARAPPYELTAAIQHNVVPQAMMAQALKRPSGRTWRRRFVGYSMAR
jgi:hypothetical protein